MKFRLLLLSVFFISSFALTSQTYQVIADIAPYVPLENSISLTEGEEWDDEEYSIALDFDINLFGDVFSTLFVDANGVLSNEGFYYDYDKLTALLPYNVDLIDRGSGSGESQSNISYVVEGEDGDRILKIEWSNVGFFEDYYAGTSASFANIQAWIYENDESIEYRYGDNLIADETIFAYYGGGPLVGMLHNLDGNGYDETFDEFLLLAGEPSSPVVTLVEVLDDIDYGEFLTAPPAPNTRYRFTRMGVSTKGISERSNQFSIYPNPVSAFLNLVENVDAEEIQSVVIYSNDGRLIKTIASDYSNINVSDLVSGVYHLNILTTDGLAVKRFVKID